MIGIYQLIFALFAMVVVGVLLGFKFAINIHNPVLYILFWAMYFITFLCIVAIIANIYFFDDIRYKEGPQGKKGEKGESGKMGETGVCDPNCREEMYYVELIKYCEDYLNSKEKKMEKPIIITNKYWKDRITMIVKSKEFTNLSTLKGVQSVLKYIKKILKVWMDLIYKEGGRLYFESIGAENEFEWRDNNPWTEIKKYDLYYWSMSSMFRIREINKCRKQTRKESEARIYGINSDDYSIIFGHKHRLGRSDSNHSFWKPNELKQDDKTLYPLGDIFEFQYQNQKRQDKDHKRGPYVFDGGYDTGPQSKTMLVAGDVKPPIGVRYIGNNYYKWCKNWLCRISNYRAGKRRKAYVRYFRFIPPEGYICLGDTARVDGYPNTNDYRCIPKDCVEPLNKGLQLVYMPDGDAGVFKSGGGKEMQNESNNLFFAYPKHNWWINSDKTMYRIKPECLKPDDIPPEVDPVYSKGWYPDPPSKDKKYSVMNYLSLPTEAILVNKGNPRIYVKIRHIEGQRYNAYHIIQTDNGNDVDKDYERKLEALNPTQLKWKRNVKNPLNDTFVFIINNDSKDYGNMTILSEAHNQYLRIPYNGNIELVQHNRADKYCYWKIM
jgi:hypothetical protein